MFIVNYLVAIFVICNLNATFSWRVSSTTFNSSAGRTDLPKGRIINGSEASIEDGYSQASIRRSFLDFFYFGAGHICGGSLISLSLVVSAAHCFVDFDSYDKHYNPPTDYIVVMGILNRAIRNNNAVVRGISSIIYKTSQFNIETFKDDIALLFLNESVPALHPTVHPIPINLKRMPAGTICQATGWGKDENDISPIILRRVYVPILSDQVCINETKFDSNIFGGMICAGYMKGGRDTCTGDSGGPLICNNTLTGIISWSEGCAQPGTPGVYTDLSFYSQWIETTLAQLSAR